MNLRPPIDDRTRPVEIARKLRALPATEDEDSIYTQHRSVRSLIWIYFWLLLVEGALRKWFLPGLANPLLVIRDPVVILIYFSAMSARVFPWNGFVLWTLGLSVISAATSVSAEHGNPLVTLYGLRSNYLHLPLIFVMQKVFNLKDVEKVGKWLLISAIPMALLVVIQFRSSPNAWVNAGVGGAEGAQMTVGFDKIRPPGTFSFTSGMASYLALLAAVLMATQIKRGSISPKLALLAVPAVGAMIAVSGSRTVLSMVALILAGVAYICVRKPEYFGKGVRTALLVGAAFFALQLSNQVRLGMMVHQSRVETGGGVRSGLVDRQLSGYLEPFEAIKTTPLLGAGIGLGTTAGAGLLNKGERSFLLAEGEWLRVVKESGPVVGFLYLGLRVALVVALGLAAGRALANENPTPMLLFCATFPSILSGQFGITTILGFATFSGGLCLAAANMSGPRGGPEPFQISPDSVTNPNRTVRGRSIYAEKLHGR